MQPPQITLQHASVLQLKLERWGSGTKVLKACETSLRHDSGWEQQGSLLTLTGHAYIGACFSSGTHHAHLQGIFPPHPHNAVLTSR